MRRIHARSAQAACEFVEGEAWPSKAIFIIQESQCAFLLGNENHKVSTRDLKFYSRFMPGNPPAVKKNCGWNATTIQHVSEAGMQQKRWNFRMFSMISDLICVRARLFGVFAIAVVVGFFRAKCFASLL